MALSWLVVALMAAAAIAGFWAGAAIARRRQREINARWTGASSRMAARLQELEAERARTAALLSGMVEGVLVVDANGRLQLVNDAARRMLKLDANLLGRHYIEAVRQPGVVQQLGAALNGEKRPPIEVPLDASVGTTGGPRIFRAQATPATDQGNGAVLVLHDISDLRRVDRVRKDFVANVSHELRTPLTAVRGYVEALMDESADPQQQRTFLGVIDRHTRRMERLVGDLLHLARLDAHQEAARMQPTDVSALFRAVSLDLAGPIEQQRIGLDIGIDPAAAVINVDPDKLHDALRNLLENAVAYSPAGGRIELGARCEDGRVLLTVADHGPGLPETDLGRVFERFYRVEKSRARDQGGTGLGLSIVRHLVELHGGRVHAENRRDGSGAIFTVSLPAR